MRRGPLKIEQEIDQLLTSFLSQFPEEEAIDHLKADEEVDSYIAANGSYEAKAWWEYCGKVGDEGELLEKDGTSMRDSNGFWVQDFEKDAMGYAVNSDSKRLFYKDGTPVKYPDFPECISKMYIEEQNEMD